MSTISEKQFTAEDARTSVDLSRLSMWRCGTDAMLSIERECIRVIKAAAASGFYACAVGKFHSEGLAQEIAGWLRSRSFQCDVQAIKSQVPHVMHYVVNVSWCQSK